MSLAEVPARGTTVRRKRDSNLFTVGAVRNGGYVGNVYHEGQVVQLLPVWEGRTHDKTVARFLVDFEAHA